MKNQFKKVVLKNLRINAEFEVDLQPSELAKIVQKYNFSLTPPYGVNKGISDSPLIFYKKSRDLLVSDFLEYGKLAHWQLKVVFHNDFLISFILDFGKFTFNDFQAEVQFKITPLLDNVKNYDKKTERLLDLPTQSVKINKGAYIVQEGRIESTTGYIYQADPSPDVFNVFLFEKANTLISDELTDFDGLEFNADLGLENWKTPIYGANPYKMPKNSILTFRVNHSPNQQDWRVLHLNIKAQGVSLNLSKNNNPFFSNIIENNTYNVALCVAHQYMYEDGTDDFKIVKYTSKNFKPSLYESKNFEWNLPNGQLYSVYDLQNFPYPPPQDKSISSIYVHIFFSFKYVESAVAYNLLCNFEVSYLKITHDYLTINKNLHAVRLTDYLSKFDNFLSLENLPTRLNDKFLSSTNFAHKNVDYLECKLPDILETISAFFGLVLIEKNEKYFFVEFSELKNFGKIYDLQNLIYEKSISAGDEFQSILIEVDDFKGNAIKLNRQIYNNKRFFIDLDNFANLDELKITPKIVVSAEKIINKLTSQTYDDQLFLFENVGSKYVFNDFFSPEKIFGRLKSFLSSFFSKKMPIYQKLENQTEKTIFEAEPSPIFKPYIVNFSFLATESDILSLLQEFRLIRCNDGKTYLPIDIEINTTPSVIQIKCLEFE